MKNDYYMQKIIDATKKCVKEIRKALRRSYMTGRIKATRNNFNRLKKNK